MGNKKITDLPSATAVNAGDKVEIVQGGTSKQVDANLLSGSGLSGLTTNKVLKATSSTTAGDSNITDDGTTVTVNSPAIITSDAGNNQIISIDNLKALVAHDVKILFNSPIYSFANMQANETVETDANKNLVSVAKGTAYNKDFGTAAGTVLEGDRITQTITNGVTDKVPSEDAVFDGLATKAGNLIAKQNTTISHTGTTAETKIYSTQLPVGTFQANDIFNLMMKAYGATGVGSKNFKVYINTSDAVGGVQIALLTVSATSVAGIFERNMFFKNSLSSQQILFATTSFVNECFQSANTGSYSNLTIDFTQLQYLVVSCTLATAGDTAQILGLTGKIER